MVGRGRHADSLPGPVLRRRDRPPDNLDRYYNPDTARYVTPDPLGLAPSPNPNSYPHNFTAWTDPLGLVPEECSYSHSAADAARMREDLRIQQLSGDLRSLYTDSESLASEALEIAQPIIRGDRIGNPRFHELIAERGQDLGDWAKYQIPSLPASLGKAESHFYMNRDTREVLYELNYKTKVIFE